MDRIMPVRAMARILIAEDEADSRKCLCQLLQSWGYDCAAAANGAEALALARSFHPQVIIMDLMMPVLDGLEATRRLKASATTRTIPVLALTSSVTAEDRHQADLAGFDGFLSKPTNFDQLLLHLRRHASAGSGAR